MDSFDSNNSVSGKMIFLVASVLISISLIYFLCIRKPVGRSSLMREPSAIRRNREQRQDDDCCCICLVEPKVLEVSATCGHSFCGNCLLGLHDHRNEKLQCPLCRNDIEVIFKVFRDQQPRAVVQNLEEKIRQYNRKYGKDERSIWRKFLEFPYVLRAMSFRLFSGNFIRFFFSGGYFLRMIFTIVAYFISPIDVLPEALLGVAGYLDDVGVMILVAGYTIANAAVQYIRQRH